MNHPPVHPMAPTGPVIPPPPARIGPRRKRTSVRLLIWPLAFVLGMGLGAAAYQWVPALGFYIDHWVVLFS
ncbi:MAG: hypothetical protein WKG00_12895 [Polyangiaceae bacterium]